MIIKFIKDFYNTILELIFPEDNLCLLCNKHSEEVDNHICKDCLEKLVFVSNKRCEICGRPLKPSYIPDLCHDCISKHKLFIKNMSPLIYEDYTRECIHNFKYKKRAYMYKALGSIMVKYLYENTDIKFDLILPIPLNKKRMLERGFNQAELLSKYISKFTNVPHDAKTLLRIKNTQKQNKLKRADRINNMKNAFSIKNNNHIKNKVILLVDDIYTTGTTINECCKVLLKNGVKKVYVLTLAIGYNEYN